MRRGAGSVPVRAELTWGMGGRVERGLVERGGRLRQLVLRNLVAATDLGPSAADALAETPVPVLLVPPAVWRRAVEQPELPVARR